jgi:hypothetical protein
MVQRYDYDTKIVNGWKEHHGVFENDDGGYVKYEDYLAMAAQVEALKYQLREKDSMLVEASDRVDANINEKYAAFEKLNASVVHNQELAAQVGAFKKIREDWQGLAINDAKTLIAFIEAADATPAACLAQVRAEAVEAFALQVSDSMDDGIDRAKLIILASEYVSSIRQEVK